jgi:hypothetical protein
LVEDEDYQSQKALETAGFAGEVDELVAEAVLQATLLPTTPAV